MDCSLPGSSVHGIVQARILEWVAISFSRRSSRLRDWTQVFPGGSDGKESSCNVGDPGSIPGLGKSPGEGNGNPLQYSCLDNPMDRGAWSATVHGVGRVGHDWATSLMSYPLFKTSYKVSLQFPKGRKVMRLKYNNNNKQKHKST